MAEIGIFIGISKFQDLDIRELNGAQHDALKLWALFSDTFQGMDCELLTDSEATLERVREALDKSLGNATSEDTVIISFSSHGTRDHRLVVYDTQLDKLTQTALPMEDLANRFKTSKAKAILCILDCCFSGKAPARVLENSPIPRDTGIYYEALAGEGRILIAASSPDKPAYELPGAGHGILSKVIIDLLQEPTDAFDLLEILNEAMNRVRQEANRIGMEQSPVLFGSIKGGLVFNPLRKGTNYATVFFETDTLCITEIIDDLKAFGFPDEILSVWANRFKNGLNNLQISAVNDYRILDGSSLLVVAPTSSGKTFVGELAAAKAILEGRKTVFLLPYRALVNEKYGQFVTLYQERLGMRVIRCTGDYVDETTAFVRGKYDLAILTYEMYLNLIVGNSHILNLIGLVVLDEAQFITDPVRGISIELLLTYMIAARSRGIHPQIIALSAVIGDINDFDLWLGCKKLVTYERPVPLIEGVLDRSGLYQYLDLSGKAQTEQLLPPSEIYVRTDKFSAQDMIIPLVKLLAGNGEKIIVFRNKRGPAQGCAAYLARELGLDSATEFITALPNHDLSSTSTDLRKCLSGGTAFHNTNLTREEKTIIEGAFRQSNSSVRVLAATTTLAAGINTPASTVIIAEKEFVGEDGRPFTVSEYKNMAGRAGRVGFENEQGKAIILADTAYEREILFHKYVLGELEPLHSSFEPKYLETWIIRLLSQVEDVPREKVIQLLANTYGGFIASRRQPDWASRTGEQLEELITKMISLGLLDERDNRVNLTLLGKACGQSLLSFSSTISLVELLKRLQENQLSALQLMALIQGLPECDDIYTPVVKGNSEAGWIYEATRLFGNEVISLLQNRAIDMRAYYARCKRTVILWAWINGVPLEIIEKQYSKNLYIAVGYGDIRKVADSTRFYLRSAFQIAILSLVGFNPNEQTIETLLKQLEVGIPADAIDLLEIPMSLTRGEYLALYNAGIKTKEDFLASETIKAILGQTRA